MFVFVAIFVLYYFIVDLVKLLLQTQALWQSLMHLLDGPAPFRKFHELVHASTLSLSHGLRFFLHIVS